MQNARSRIQKSGRDAWCGELNGVRDGVEAGLWVIGAGMVPVDFLFNSFIHDANWISLSPF